MIATDVCSQEISVREQLVQKIITLRQTINYYDRRSLEHAREIGALLLAVESKVDRRLIEIEAGFRGRTGRTAYDYRRIAREWNRVARLGSIRHANQILKTRRQKARKTVPVLVEAEWMIDELNIEEVARALAQVKGRSVKITVSLTRYVQVDAEQPGLFDVISASSGPGQGA